MAILCYLPLIFTKPGLVSVDSKQYLYLDPQKYMVQSASIWSPNIDMGTVTHQIIGFLMPMSEWYAVFAFLHIPVYLAQRLWLGSVYFMAGSGVFYFCRSLGLSKAGSTLSGVAYMLSPYMFQYEISMSDLLLPMAALGWMMGFTIKALRDRKDIYCLLFAIAVAISSTINATSFIYVAIGPVLLVIHSLVVRDTTLRRAISVSVKCLLLSFLVSLYWIEGLIIEGAYGVNILKLSESLTAISATSSPAEVFRGLGYWYFYASDSYGPIVKAAVQYQSWVWLLLISLVIPSVAIVSALFIKWRYKSLSLGLILVGLVISVGLYPLSNPSPIGSKVETYMNTTELGLALRSTTRATPIVVLGLAMLLGALSSLLLQRSIRTGGIFTVLMLLLTMLNAPGVFIGDTVTSNMARGAIPSYWTQAGKYLNSKSNLTRVLQEPGQPFETYNFGTTIDPILPGLTNRPTVERRQVPLGSNYGVNLLDNLDNQFQRSDLNPNGLSAILKLMSAGDMLITNDVAYERYQVPPPQITMSMLDPLPPGFDQPKTFGSKTTDFPPYQLPYFDPQTLTGSEGVNRQYPLVDFPVKNARPIVRLESAQIPLIIDGDGLGVIEAANAGLLKNNPTIFYAASKTKSQLRTLAKQGATLVVTDSNRKQTKIWSTFADQNGEIETPGQSFANANNNETDFNIFPDASNSTKTTVFYENVDSITASSYGYPYGFAPELRPYSAFDGHLSTAWMTGALGNPVGQWISVKLNSAVTSNKIRINQMLSETPDRWIDKLKITLYLKSAEVKTFTVDLDASSRAPSGQVINFNETKFDNAKFTITGVHNSNSTPISSVGISQININNIFAKEVVKPPSDLLSAVGNLSSTDRLIYIFSRQMVGEGSSRTSPEVNITRQMTVPTPRKFLIAGDATLSSSVSDSRINSIIYGNRLEGSNFAVTNSSSKLQGDVGAYSGSIDTGNNNSAWISTYGTSGLPGSWIEFDSPKFIRFNEATLTVYDDGMHSLPSQIDISTESGRRVIQLNKNVPFKTKNNLLTFNLRFPTLSGKRIRMTIDAVRPVTPKNYYGSTPATLPIAVSHFNVGYAASLPSNEITTSTILTGSYTASDNLLAVPQFPKNLPYNCRNDLASIDGEPIWLNIVGSVNSALEGKYLGVVGCGPDAGGINVGTGQHIVETALGSKLGINIDQIEFDSLNTFQTPPIKSKAFGYLTPATTTKVPGSIKLLSMGNTDIKIKVDTYGKPLWVVLGENFSTGWQARILGSVQNKNALNSQPSLIDAYANGWLLNPQSKQQIYEIELSFVPQKTINYSLVISFGTLFICIAGSILLVLIYKKRSKKTKISPQLFKTDGPILSFEKLLGYPGHNLSWVTSVVFGILSAIVAGFGIKPVFGFITGLVSFIFSRFGIFRILILAVSITLLAMGVFGIVLGEWIHGYGGSGSWPSLFNNQSNYIYLAIVMVVTDASIVFVRNFRTRKH